MRAAGVIALVLSALALASGCTCAKSQPAPGKASCTKDSECFVSAEMCCKSCCDGLIHATTPAQFEADRAACAPVKCPESLNCDGTTCPAAPGVDEFEAFCRNGFCVAEQRTSPAPVTSAPVADQPVDPDYECDANTECEVSDFTCCPSCCEHQVYAAPTKRLEKLPGQCPPECPPKRNCASAVCGESGNVKDFEALCENHHCKAVKKRLGATPPAHLQ